MEISELKKLENKAKAQECRFPDFEDGFYTVIPEEKLKQEMENTVEPYLKSIQKTGTIVTDHPLYFEWYPREKNIGTVVISYGFTESVLKYHELIYYFHRHGYQVAILDHRGHGKSFREVEDMSLVHVESFRQYVEDLHTFVSKQVRQSLPENRPQQMYLFGHSMGGCIAARYAELYPEDFCKIILNAPMLGVLLGHYPPWAAAILCDLNILTGQGRRRLFYQHGFQPDEPFCKSSASSEARFRYYHALRRQDETCQTYSATYRWAREAIRAGWLVRRKKEAAKVTAPVLLFQAGKDTLVAPDSHDIFLNRIRNGRMIRVPEIRHEIYRAGNEVLAPYLREIFSFFDD